MLSASFKTHKNWELKGGHRIFTDKDERLYPFVETVLCTNIFVVDFIEQLQSDDPDNPDLINKTLLLDGTFKALKLISSLGDQVQNFRLIPRLKVNCDEDIVVSKITEIIFCNDAYGQSAFIIKLKSGQTLVDSAVTDDIRDLKEISSFYKDQNLTNEWQAYLSSF